MTRLIPLKHLSVHPENPRKTTNPSYINALAISIHSVGLLNPLLVCEHDESKDGYWVVAGQCRLLALQQLNKPDIEVECIEVRPDMAAAIALADNEVRTAMHPVDEYRAYAHLMYTLDDDADRVAGVVGKSKRHVMQRMKLGCLSDKVLNAFANGDITLEIAMALTRCGDPSMQEHWLTEIQEQRIRTWQLPAAIDQHQLRPKHALFDVSTVADPDWFSEDGWIIRDPDEFRRLQLKHAKLRGSEIAEFFNIPFIEARLTSNAYTSSYHLDDWIEAVGLIDEWDHGTPDDEDEVTSMMEHVAVCQTPHLIAMVSTTSGMVEFFIVDGKREEAPQTIEQEEAVEERVEIEAGPDSWGPSANAYLQDRIDEANTQFIKDDKWAAYNAVMHYHYGYMGPEVHAPSAPKQMTKDFKAVFEWLAHKYLGGSTQPNHVMKTIRTPVGDYWQVDAEFLATLKKPQLQWIADEIAAPVDCISMKKVDAIDALLPHIHKAVWLPPLVELPDDGSDKADDLAA